MNETNEKLTFAGASVNRLEALGASAVADSSSNGDALGATWARLGL